MGQIEWDKIYSEVGHFFNYSAGRLSYVKTKAEQQIAQHKPTQLIAMSSKILKHPDYSHDFQEHLICLFTLQSSMARRPAWLVSNSSSFRFVFLCHDARSNCFALIVLPDNRDARHSSSLKAVYMHHLLGRKDLSHSI